MPSEKITSKKKKIQRRRKQPWKLKRMKIQSYFEQMLRIYPLVAEILKNNQASRDDDNILCFKIWKKQGAKEKWTVKKLKYNVIMNRLASPETIGRSRRRLQEKNSFLRGLLYRERHDAEENMRNQMKLDL